MLRLTPKTHSVNITYNPKDLCHAFMRIYIYLYIHINIFLTFHSKFLWVMCVSASDTRNFSKRFSLLSEKHWFTHVFFSFFPLRQSSAGTFAINLSNISCAPGLGWIVKDSPHISPSRHAVFCLIPTWKLRAVSCRGNPVSEPHHMKLSGQWDPSKCRPAATRPSSRSIWLSNQNTGLTSLSLSQLWKYAGGFFPPHLTVCVKSRDDVYNSPWSADWDEHQFSK